MRQVVGQTTNDFGSPPTGSVLDRKANLLRKLSWFLRICGVLALVVSMPRIMHEGWPPSLRASGGLMGLVQASMLFVMSFLYVTSGRTKLIIAAVTIVLAVCVMGFAAAWFVLPHP